MDCKGCVIIQIEEQNIIHIHERFYYKIPAGMLVKLTSDIIKIFREIM